jgi:hypothetical protein
MLRVFEILPNQNHEKWSMDFLDREEHDGQILEF